MQHQGRPQQENKQDHQQVHVGEKVKTNEQQNFENIPRSVLKNDHGKVKHSKHIKREDYSDGLCVKEKKVKRRQQNREAAARHRER